MQVSQIDTCISQFTLEQAKVMLDLSKSEDKKEAKLLHKQLRSITGVLNNLLSLKSLVSDD